MLSDSYRRIHDYLRISVTDRCNLRCVYCVPPQGISLLSHDEVLRNEEFVRLAGIFISLGVNKVRFTGGEPLLRRGFFDIVSAVHAAHPRVALCLTTNGTLLGRFLEDLHRLRVHNINVSLDTMSPSRYRDITGSDGFHDVLASIDRALDIGEFRVKINAVLLEDTIQNIDEFLEHFKDRNVTIRFIERMPFGARPPEGTVPAARLIDALRLKGDLLRNEVVDTNVAVMYDFLYHGRYPMRIGVIPPVTEQFCGRCNRLRISSDGMMRTCLQSSGDCDLKALLRGGADDMVIAEAVRKAVASKHEGHLMACRDDGGCASLASFNAMSRIGG